MDYYSKYIKYKSKYIEIKKKRGGAGLESKTTGRPNVFIPYEMNIEIIKNLSFDEKLKFIETLVELPEPFDVNSESAIQIRDLNFNVYISENCFSNSELNEIRNSGEYYALNGCLKLLKLSLLFNPNYNLNEETCAGAAYEGHLDILKGCREHDCPWNQWTCDNAAEYGYLEILKWCRQQDPPCPWNENTCACAAGAGQFEILKWCREQDPPCPWDESTCVNAALEEHWDIFKWCIEQDCPCDEMFLYQAQKYYT